MRDALKKIIDWFKNLSLFKKIGSAIFLILIAVIGNIISHRINKSYDSEDNNSAEKEQNINTLTYPKPFFKLANYYIQVKNTTYPDLDTLVAIYNGPENRILDLNGIELLNNQIDDDVNLYSGPDVAPFSISLIDSYSKKDTLFLEVSRRMIFDGFHAAWFNQEDKHQIGEMTFRIPYKIGNEVFNDTLTNRIYLIK